jgi:hypothetical protein
VTEEQQRLGFAKVLVEVDVDSALPKDLVVDVGDGKLITFGVEYPWLPIKCTQCKSFDHSVHACTQEEKQSTKEFIKKPGHSKFEFNLVARADGNVQKAVKEFKKPEFDRVIRRPTGHAKEKVAKDKGRLIKVRMRMLSISLS